MAGISAQSDLDNEGITAAKNIDTYYATDDAYNEYAEYAEDDDAYAEEVYEYALRGGGVSEATSNEDAVEQYEADVAAEPENASEAEAEAETGGLRGGGSLDEAAFEDLIYANADDDVAAVEDAAAEDPAASAEYFSAPSYATEPKGLRGGGSVSDTDPNEANPQAQAESYQAQDDDPSGLRGGSGTSEGSAQAQAPDAVQNVTAVDEHGNVVNTFVISLSAFGQQQQQQPQPDASSQPQIIVIQQGDQGPVVIGPDGNIQALSAMSGGPPPPPSSSSQLGYSSAGGIQMIDMSALAAQLQAAGGASGTIELQAAGPGQQPIFLSVVGASASQLGGVGPPPGAPSAPPPPKAPAPSQPSAPPVKGKGVAGKTPAGTKSKAPAKAAKTAAAKGKAGKLSTGPARGKGAKGGKSDAPAKGKGAKGAKSSAPAKGKSTVPGGKGKGK